MVSENAIASLMCAPMMRQTRETLQHILQKIVQQQAAFFDIVQWSDVAVWRTVRNEPR